MSTVRSCCGSPRSGCPSPARSPTRRRWPALASVRLFIERVRDLSPDFTLDRTNAAAVVEICRRLDGMPLALELAAARTAYLEPAEIAERLGDALSVLGRPGTATRHATLRAALEWSYDLLTAEEQCLLRRLAVFEGGCTVAAAEQVCAGGPVPSGAVLDVLGRLVDKSLVQVDRITGRSRYRLLDTVRQLAAERLQLAGETGALRDAHSDFFRESRGRARPGRLGDDAGRAAAAARPGARQPAGRAGPLTRGRPERGAGTGGQSLAVLDGARALRRGRRLAAPRARRGVRHRSAQGRRAAGPGCSGAPARSPRPGHRTGPPGRRPAGADGRAGAGAGVQPLVRRLPVLAGGRPRRRCGGGAGGGGGRDATAAWSSSRRPRTGWPG